MSGMEDRLVCQIPEGNLLFFQISSLLFAVADERASSFSLEKLRVEIMEPAQRIQNDSGQARKLQFTGILSHLVQCKYIWCSRQNKKLLQEPLNN